MGGRILLAVALVSVLGEAALGQTPGPAPVADSAWRPADASVAAPAGVPAAPVGAEGPRRTIARVSGGSGTLPNQHGQVWREYDISPYTARVTTTKRPEQAIVDWILRETGYEVWHSEPLGILSATPRTLRVYHTPEMQALVAEVVDRFVASEAENQTFSLRVMTIDSPNWRVRAQSVLHPVPVQTPGVSAWLLQREDAAVVLAELERRPDYREHSSPHLLVNNGQATVVSCLRPRCYVRDVTLRPDVFPGYIPQNAQIDEGFSLEFSPLLSVDRRLIDAAVKCNIDQVERMVPVMFDVAAPGATRQRAKIEVPQMSQLRFHERFRWPVDQVLLIGMGMVAPPVPVDNQVTLGGLPLPLPATPPRADLLLMVESKGPAIDAARSQRAADREARVYRGRY
jgi:hypothetical protein